MVFQLYSEIINVLKLFSFLNPKSTIQNPKLFLNRVFVQALGTHAGRLYGLNTIGAAFGALLCGFWLINLLGVWGTLILAVVVNAVIGFSCILVGYKARSGRESGGVAVFDREESRRKDTPEEAEALQYPGAEIGALVIFAVSGFSAMAYEVMWTNLGASSQLEYWPPARRGTILRLGEKRSRRPNPNFGRVKKHL